MHIEDNSYKFSGLSFTERLACLNALARKSNTYLGHCKCPCGEVYCIVSLFWRVHYQRFYCNKKTVADIFLSSFVQTNNKLLHAYPISNILQTLWI